MRSPLSRYAVDLTFAVQTTTLRTNGPISETFGQYVSEILYVRLQTREQALVRSSFCAQKISLTEDPLQKVSCIHSNNSGTAYTHGYHHLTICLCSALSRRPAGNLLEPLRSAVLGGMMFLVTVMDPAE